MKVILTGDVKPLRFNGYRCPNPASHGELTRILGYSQVAESVIVVY